jgi:nucleoside-diphosphate-sugar epimerase
MSIRWITPLLGTAAALDVKDATGAVLVDVRMLVDKPGNNATLVRDIIERGASALSAGSKTIVCCDYGISRSNAIACGILARYRGVDLQAAIREVLSTTGEREIKVELLHAVRRSLPVATGGQSKCKRVLITGGQGFIGRNLIAALQNEPNLELVCPDSAAVDLLKGAAELDLLVNENGIDRIVHLANPRVYTSNVALGAALTMLRNTLDVCVNNAIPLTFLSDWEVYSGYSTSGLLADEAVPLLPKGPYGEAKHLCEMMLSNFQMHHPLSITLLRSSRVYGVGGDKPKFIYSFMDHIRRSESITTHSYLNASPALDLLHVDDLVEAIRLSILADYNGCLNLGTGRLTTTREIAKMLCDILNKHVPIDSVAIESDTACIAMDNRKALHELKWQPQMDLRSGLTQLANYTEESGGRLEK